MGGATNRVLTLLSFSSSTTTHFATFPLLLRLPFLSKLSFLPPPLFLSHRRFFSSSFPCFSLHASHHFHSQTPLKLENFSKPSSSSSPSFRSSSPHHPWPEWSRLVESLFSAGYFNRNLGFDTDNEFIESAALPQDFENAVSACLAFAREKPGLLRLLSRRDMEVAIEHGTPFLFRNSDDSAIRLRSFLSSGNMNVLDTDKAHTVDLMRFILSYASNPLLSSESNNFYNKELVESSIRNLLSELAKLCYSVPDLKSFGSVQRHITEGNGQMERSIGHNIEMKRGDWICPRCSFMNFARNMKCLECEEARPKRQLTGGEWECPQCDFFNYGRNVTCLRCDCKRPGDVSIATTTSNKVETDSRLAANEEEAQKWFSKVSQLDNNSDLNAAADNENFPEILRKGVNRIEANTRRTPLERQLENAQYQRKLGNNASAAGPKVDLSDPSCIPSSVFPQHVQSIEGNSNYVPFVPLPADMAAMEDEEELNQIHTLNFHRLKVIMPLGRGAKGVVFLVKDEERDEFLALKVISKALIERKGKSGNNGDQNEYRRVYFEQDVLRRFDHPLFPKLRGVFDTEKLVGYAIDYCPGRDLHSLRKRQTEKMFSDEVIRFFAAELVIALEYLHSLGIVYRDLKPENIMIQENGHIMLVDFDLSTKLSPRTPRSSPSPNLITKSQPVKKKKRFSPFERCCNSGISQDDSVSPTELIVNSSRTTSNSSEKSNSFVGTEDYMAPEVVSGNGHYFAVDWWSLGVLLYEMLYGTTPFKGCNRKETFYRILTKEPELTGEPTSLRDLIRKLLEKDQRQRIGIEEIKGHDFFRGTDWDSLVQIPRPPYIPENGNEEDISVNNDIDVESIVQEIFETDNVEKSDDSGLEENNYEVKLEDVNSKTNGWVQGLNNQNSPTTDTGDFLFY